MPGPHPKTLFHQLALSVAAGEKIKSWCQKHKIARGTAYDWSKRDSFKRLVAEYRRRAVDRAIGKMARNLSKAVGMIVHLIEAGQTDNVKLSAAKTLIDRLLTVQSHAELKAELLRLDDRLAAQEGRRASGTRKPPGAGHPA
jgi:hypothetical protein